MLRAAFGAAVGSEWERRFSETVQQRRRRVGPTRWSRVCGDGGSGGGGGGAVGRRQMAEFLPLPGNVVAVVLTHGRRHPVYIQYYNVRIE